MHRLLLVGTALLTVFVTTPTARQIPPYGGAAEYRADLGERRGRVLERLGPESVLVMWSAPTRVYSTDVDYEYRQDSNLLYLTGIEQPETVLVLVPGASTRRAWLFISAADPRRELWNGHLLTPAEATAASGIENVRTLDKLQPFIEGLLAASASEDTPAAEFGAWFDAVKQSKAKLAILDRVTGGARGGGPGAGGAMAPVAPEPGSRGAWAQGLQQKFTGVTAVSVPQILTTLRQLKTPYEQRVLRRSVEISAEAHVEGMREARPGRWEYEVEAAIEHWYLKNGALSWGYPSIVGSGPNATTLHYVSSTRQMKDGDLLLIDAAANFQGLTGDITRTYPVNGRFTREQRDIYELVLAAQDAGFAAVKRGGRAADVTAACRAVFAAGLLKLGLIAEATPGPIQNQQVSLWFPHGPTHGIGIDVHDPLGTFEPGAAFVIEPGLYIRPDTLENLPKTPENAALVEKLRPAVQKYQHIGVRIEDSYLFTENGVETLSAKAPKKIADLERIIGKGR